MASMSDRDRKLLMAIVPIVLIVAYWFLLLGPKRQDASTAAASLSKQEARRDVAKADLMQASGAKTDFSSDYTQIVRLGKAIPASVDMASLLIQLDGAAKGTGIHFTKIATGERTPVVTAATPPAAGSTPPAGSEGSGTSTTPAATAGGQPAQSAPGQAAEGANNTAAQGNTAAAQSGVDATTSTTASPGGLPVGGGAGAPAGTDGAAATGPAGLETVPLDLEFTGDFFRLANFFHDIKRFVHVVNQDVVVNGRLLTIESVTYTSDPLLFPRIRAQVKATVYLSPQTEGATAGATPYGPAATTPATTPAATPEPSSTPSPAPTAAATP